MTGARSFTVEPVAGRNDVIRVTCPSCDLAQVAPSAPRSSRVHLRCIRCDQRWPPPDGARTNDRRAESARCVRHAARRARWLCAECEEAYCDDCAERVPGSAGHEGVLSSPCCHGLRVPIARLEVARPFWVDLPNVLIWPLRRAGIVMLLMFWLASFIPLLSWLALLVLAAYLQQILRVSARGATHLPPYPAIDNVVVDVVYPLARFIVVLVVLWGPAMLYRRWTGAAADDPVLWVLRSIPILFGPFAITVASVARSSRVLLDVPLMSQILGRTFGDYALTWSFLLLLVLIHGMLRAVAASSDVALIALSALRYYALFLAFHVLGRFVMQTRHVVDWEI